MSVLPTPMSFTNSLITDRHVLVCLGEYATGNLATLKANFCGRVITSTDAFEEFSVDDEHQQHVYLCGNIDQLLAHKPYLATHPRVWLVQGCVHGECVQGSMIKVIPFGGVPINVHGVGVMLREWLAGDVSYFERISQEHEFQQLTESNKTGVAYRTGVYITPVDVEHEQGKEPAHKFHLLRCSSNFDGPTNNVQATDGLILQQLADVAKQHFSVPTSLNHVLAQIYHNTAIGGRDKKAVISRHSDKTKDMPLDGLMAFCTFYAGYDAVNKTFPGLAAQKVARASKADDPFDFRYKNGSVLTRLRFKRKAKEASQQSAVKLTDDFDVVLYPNSVFVMPLEMNRLYTHEIVPSHLPIHLLPVRMGYVVRCSKTQAVHQNGQTFLYDASNKLVPLQAATTADGMAHIKKLYTQENQTQEFVDYGFIPLSMNIGDLKAPIMLQPSRAKEADHQGSA